MKIKTSEFGLAQHRFREFEAIVPGSTTNEDLTKSEAWTHVAGQLQPGDEIRVRAEDDSFVARLYVTYRQGTDTRVFVIYRADLEVVDPNTLLDENAPYFVQLRGTKKWCIIKRETGDIVKEMIATQKGAFIELDDYVRALAA